MKAGSKIVQEVLIGAIGVSFHLILTASDQNAELKRQLTSWIGAIIGDLVGAKTSHIIGPVGTILSTIMGSFMEEGSYALFKSL